MEIFHNVFFQSFFKVRTGYGTRVGQVENLFFISVLTTVS